MSGDRPTFPIYRAHPTGWRGEERSVVVAAITVYEAPSRYMNTGPEGPRHVNKADREWQRTPEAALDVFEERARAQAERLESSAAMHRADIALAAITRAALAATTEEEPT